MNTPFNKAYEFYSSPNYPQQKLDGVIGPAVITAAKTADAHGVMRTLPMIQLLDVKLNYHSVPMPVPSIQPKKSKKQEFTAQIKTSDQLDYHFNKVTTDERYQDASWAHLAIQRLGLEYHEMRQAGLGVLYDMFHTRNHRLLVCEYGTSYENIAAIQHLAPGQPRPSIPFAGGYGDMNPSLNHAILVLNAEYFPEDSPSQSVLVHELAHAADIYDSQQNKCFYSNSPVFRAAFLADLARPDAAGGMYETVASVYAAQLGDGRRGYRNEQEIWQEFFANLLSEYSKNPEATHQLFPNACKVLDGLILPDILQRERTGSHQHSWFAEAQKDAAVKRITNELNQKNAATITYFTEAGRKFEAVDLEPTKEGRDRKMDACMNAFRMGWQNLAASPPVTPQDSVRMIVFAEAAMKASMGVYELPKVVPRIQR